MKRKTFLIGIAFFLINHFGFSQTTYYISTLGNDADNGTTISTPWKTIKKALTTVSAGSIIEIFTGKYSEKIIPLVTGLPSNYITVKNYQNDSVVIDGA
ncbi:MAG: hypothetical protein RL065_1220, partial [Bacteroidota bacterium]